MARRALLNMISEIRVTPLREKRGDRRVLVEQHTKPGEGA